MIQNIQLFFGFVGLLGILLYPLIEIYINLFQAEKLRRLIVSQPEYNTGWYFLVQSYKPFKWWHFYRKGMFSWLLHWALCGKPDPKSKSECVTYAVLPKFIKRLYSAEMWGGGVFFAGIILFSILNHFSS